MTMDLAFDVWSAALERAGFAVENFLNAPADESTIDGLQAGIGLPLPPDFRALYRKADGQMDSYHIKAADPGKVVMPFFGSYDFISLGRVAKQYNLWNGIFTDAGENFSRDFDHCTARNGDPVYAEYWRPGWLPFSVDGGGNSYAVDLSPAPGGTYGQVILIGPDEDERRVLAPSLSQLLLDAASQVNISAQIADQNKGIWRLFDIERRPT